MTKPQAVILLPEGGSGTEADWWARSLAGLSLLERQLLSLERAGVRRVRLVAPAQGAASEIAAFLETPPVARRLRQVSVEVVDTPAPAVSSSPTLCIDGRYLFPTALVEHTLPRGAKIRYRDDDGRCTWTGLGPEPHRRGPEPEGPCLPPPAPLWIVRADDRASRARAEERLFRSLGKESDGWFSRRLNRPLSLALTRRLAPVGLRPAIATFVTLAVGLLSGLVSAVGSGGGFVAGAVLFQAASVLDGVDGELARLQFVDSHRGAWLDTICDDVTNLAYLAGVTLGVWRQLASPVLLAAGLAALALDVLVVAFLYWRLAARGETSLLAFQDRLGRAPLQMSAWARWVGRVQPLIKRDAYGVAFLLFALIGAPWLSLVLTTVALAVTLPSVVALELRTPRCEAEPADGKIS